MQEQLSSCSGSTPTKLNRGFSQGFCISTWILASERHSPVSSGRNFCSPSPTTGAVPALGGPSHTHSSSWPTQAAHQAGPDHPRDTLPSLMAHGETPDLTLVLGASPCTQHIPGPTVDAPALTVPFGPAGRARRLPTLYHPPAAHADVHPDKGNCSRASLGQNPGESEKCTSTALWWVLPEASRPWQCLELLRRLHFSPG